MMKNDSLTIGQNWMHLPDCYFWIV